MRRAPLAVKPFVLKGGVDEMKQPVGLPGGEGTWIFFFKELGIWGHEKLMIVRIRLQFLSTKQGQEGAGKRTEMVAAPPVEDMGRVRGRAGPSLRTYCVRTQCLTFHVHYLAQSSEEARGFTSFRNENLWDQRG